MKRRTPRATVRAPARSPRIPAQFKESLAVATLQEKSIAVAVLYVDGLADIAQIITAKVSEQIMSTRHSAAVRASGCLGWPRSGLVSRPARREHSRARPRELRSRGHRGFGFASVCDSLREPIAVGDADSVSRPTREWACWASMPPRRALCWIMLARLPQRRAAPTRTDVSLLQRHAATAHARAARHCAGVARSHRQPRTSAFGTSAVTIWSPAVSSRGWRTCAGFIRCAARYGPRNSCA